MMSSGSAAASSSPSQSTRREDVEGDACDFCVSPTGRAMMTTTGLSEFPKATLQCEGDDDDGDAMLFSSKFGNMVTSDDVV